MDRKSRQLAKKSVAAAVMLILIVNMMTVFAFGEVKAEGEGSAHANEFGTDRRILMRRTALPVAESEMRSLGSTEITESNNMPMVLFYSDGRSDTSDYTWSRRNANGRFKGKGVEAYCINPLDSFVNGTKTITELVGYKGVTQELVTKIAAGIDYIHNRATGITEAERYALSQAYVWSNMRGHGFSLSSFYLDSGMAEATYSKVTAEADKWAAANTNALATARRYHSKDSQDVASFSISYEGVLTMTKESSDKTFTDKHPDNFSLKGAVYEVYSDKDLKKPVGKLTTDASGGSNKLTLPAATYYVKEISAPQGYKLDEKIHTVIVAAGKTSSFSAKDEPIKGQAALTKRIKENSPIEMGFSEAYSIAGAVYTVYSDEKMTAEICTITTDGSGKSNVIDLPEGIYYIKETKAPLGYILDPAIHKVSVSAGKTAEIVSEEEPLFAPLSAKLIKRPEEGSDPQLSVEGAEYTVKYYKELTSDTSELIPFKTWVFKTDEKGEIQLSEEYKTGGDTFFLDGSGNVIAPIGTYVFEETRAPKGFLKSEGAISIQHVKPADRGGDLTMLQDVDTVEKAQTVSILIKKADADTGKYEPQGFGSFKGAVFDVFRFDSVQEKDVKVATLSTDDNGKASLEKVIPGKYTIKEVSAPAGYVVNEHSFTVNAVVRDTTSPDFEYTLTVPEKVIDVSITKTGLGEHGVGEMPAGAELQLIDFDGNIKDSWTTDGKARNFKGLAAGKYMIHEVKAPSGYLLSAKDYEFEVRESADEQKFEVFNEPVPLIGTEAFFEGGTKNSLPIKEAHLIDKVSYDRLVPGSTYTLKGCLVDADDPENVVAVGETTFKAEKSEGEVNVKFAFDASVLSGRKLVVFEEIYKDGRLLASHSEINDRDQTVTIPEIGTEASDKSDGDKYVTPAPAQTVIDIVRYSRLTPGREYVIKGRLIDKNTGEIITVGGKEITAEKCFVPDEENGEITLEFAFDASLLKGKTAVVFESIISEGIEIAIHADIEDESQTVYFPEAKTKASSKADGGKVVLPLKDVRITDEIYFKNFDAGKSYFVEGTLINKETKELLSSSSLLFEAKAAEGEIALEFIIDASKLAGCKAVVLERIFEYDTETGTKGKIFAVHEDFEDEGQTVSVANPAIKTLASANGSKRTEAVKNIELKDKVRFSGLVPGLNYTAELVWMDKTTGKPAEVNGEKITTKKMFKPSEASGEIEMRTSVDGTVLRDAVLVAFEKISYNGEQVAAHEDIKSSEQAVSVFTKKPIVKTGDKGVALYMLLLAGASTATIALILFFKNRRRNSIG